MKQSLSQRHACSAGHVEEPIYSENAIEFAHRKAS